MTEIQSFAKTTNYIRKAKYFLKYGIQKCFRFVLIYLFLIITMTDDSIMAQNTEDTLDIEENRQKILENFDISEIPDLDKIRSAASNLFAMPIGQQKVEDLTNLSIEANRAANLISYIRDEYNDEYRDNYRYEFIQEKLAKPHDDYVRISNEFIDIRNQVYYNLGIKYKNLGETVKSFLYFNDAFRLSGFDCRDKRPDDCMRWKAEQEMKNLLQIDGIESYVTWQFDPTDDGF